MLGVRGMRSLPGIVTVESVACSAPDRLHPLDPPHILHTYICCIRCVRCKRFKKWMIRAPCVPRMTVLSLTFRRQWIWSFLYINGHCLFSFQTFVYLVFLSFSFLLMGIGSFMYIWLCSIWVYGQRSLALLPSESIRYIYLYHSMIDM